MKRWIALGLSILIMAVIFSRIDFSQFIQYVQAMNLWVFLLAVLFFVPQVLMSAFRWKVMVEERVTMGLGESVKLILTGNALNIILPSRMGDLSKAYFLKKQGKLDIHRGMNIVLFEKYLDLVSLGFVILAGIFWKFEWSQGTVLGLLYSLGMISIFPLLYFVKLDKWVSFSLFEKNKFLSKVRHFLLDSQTYLMEIKENPRKLFFIVIFSIFLWFVHILQFYVIFKAFHSVVSLFLVFRLVPLAILVGLLPITMAGIGTRDSALLYFFSAYEQPALIAGIGLFASLRYFVPGILGIPFLNRYIIGEMQESVK